MQLILLVWWLLAVFTEAAVVTHTVRVRATTVLGPPPVKQKQQLPLRPTTKPSNLTFTTTTTTTTAATTPSSSFNSTVYLNTTNEDNEMGLQKIFKEMAGRPEPVPAAPPTTPNQAPTRRQVMQNRFNHGCNFGGMFVQEEWISNEVFGEKAKGTSELDAVKSLVKQVGKEQAQAKFEQHWNNWITDNDWGWLQNHGVTAVRIPIGYWMVDNGRFCKDTDFEKFAPVYQNAWNVFKGLIGKADQYGIAVLCDLHGLPGGANGQDHSGTCSGEAKLWDSSKNQRQAIDVLEFIARDLRPNDNVCGIQILNEAPHADEATEQKDFYLAAAEKIRTVNDDIPLVISDGWELPKWVEWVQRKDGKLDGRTMGLVIDTHVYKCFGEDDKQKPPMQLVGEVDNAIMETDDADVLVGEYSCVLDGQSWDKHQGPPREQVVQQYGQRETGLFYHRARAGSYFWTYKFEHGRGGEWDFREMTEKNAIPNMKTVVKKDGGYYEQAYQHSHDQALNAHTSYWTSQDPNRDWQFWRFDEGFQMGFYDARAFDQFDNSEIGRLNAWRKSRRYEHIQAKGDGDMVWTFEHGFKQGMQAFLHARNS